MCRDFELNAVKFLLVLCLIHPKETAIGARPQSSSAVFKHSVDPISNGVIAHQVDSETRRRLGVSGWARSDARVKTSHTAPIGSYPVNAVASLEQRVDGSNGKPVFNVVVGEATAVEPAETVPGAEPQKSSRVTSNS